MNKWQVKITNDFEKDGYINFTIINKDNEIVFTAQNYKFHFHDLLDLILNGRGFYDGYDYYINNEHKGTITFENRGLK